jgi:hypothetical protein
MSKADEALQMEPVLDHFKILAACTSRDSARKNLHNIFFSPVLKAAVTTDGHRLFMSRTVYSDEFAGKVFDTKALVTERTHLDTEQEYPDVHLIVPGPKFEHAVTFQVPKWFSSLRCKVGNEEGGVTISFVKVVPSLSRDATVAVCSLKEVPVLTSGYYEGIANEESAISFDPFLMAPLAGHKVRFRWNTFEKPVLVTPVGTAEPEWSYIMMPLRTKISYLSEDQKPKRTRKQIKRNINENKSTETFSSTTV